MFRFIRKLLFIYIVFRAVVFCLTLAAGLVLANGGDSWLRAVHGAVFRAVAPGLIDIQVKRAELMGHPMPEKLEMQLRRQVDRLAE